MLMYPYPYRSTEKGGRGEGKRITAACALEQSVIFLYIALVWSYSVE